jgi:hypothetical protein
MAYSNDASLSASAALDIQLIREAQKRKAEGKLPTPQQQAAIKRADRDREERLRIEYYKTVPQKHYIRLSGRQAKILNGQKALYGIPCSEKIVNLFEVIKWFHDFLAQHGSKILKDQAEGLLGGPPTASLERLRLIKAKREEFAFEREKGLWRISDETQQAWAIAAASLRQTFDTLQRQCGPEALAIVLEGLVDAERIFMQNINADLEGKSEIEDDDNGNKHE